MTLRHLLSFATLGLLVPLAQAAGFSFIEVPADADGPALRGAVFDQCDTADALGNAGFVGRVASAEILSFGPPRIW